MNYAKLVFLLSVFISALTIAAHAQTPVFVPGNATGCFGSPDGGCAPFVAALSVSGPGMITVTYISGTVIWDGNPDDATGPNGTSCLCTGQQFPLDEARGIGLQGGNVQNLGALIGIFVPQYRAGHKGFSAFDGTKNQAPIGIMPNDMFFVGTGKAVAVNNAGTLFLGINDTEADDNSGGFTVTVSAQ